MIPLLAGKIDFLLGRNEGIMNAALLGKASRESGLHPEEWNDIGNKS